MYSLNLNEKILTFHSASTYDAAKERDNNILGKRISQARAMKKISLQRMSELLQNCGIFVSAPAISKWETGMTVPNAYQLIAISKVLSTGDTLSFFTSLPSDLNEEGLRKVQDYREDLIATGKYQLIHHHIVSMKTMPVSSMPASAGTGAFLDSDTFEPVDFPEASIPEGAEFGIRISGDSMEPVYHDGQIVWVQSCSSLNAGDVGIFVYDGDGYLKIYGEQEPSEQDREAFLSSDGSLRMQPMLISYNPKYAPKIVSPNTAFRIAGRVLAAAESEETLGHH